MAFNRNSINLGNQFSHAAAVARGDEREHSNRERDYYKVPAGMKYHKWGANEERFNVLIAKNNAMDDDNAPESYKFYKSVQVHELPNVNDPKHPHKYPCLRMIGKRCPVCEMKEQLDDGTKGGENWNRIKPYLPKERTIYYLNPEGTSDILVHECASRQPGEAAFPQRLMNQAVAMSEGSLPLPFASPCEDGRIVKVNTSKANFNGNEFFQVSAVNFFPRKELVADEVYERCLPWNEILNFASYEEMQRVMNGGEPDPSSAGAPAHTEEQKQAEFERACEESLQRQQAQQSQQPAYQPTQQAQPTYQQAQPAFQQAQPAYQPAPAQQPQAPQGFQPMQAPQGFKSTPVDQDFKVNFGDSQPQRSFPSEQVQAGGQCPNGLRFGADFETSRKCCNCSAYESCGKANH